MNLIFVAMLDDKKKSVDKKGKIIITQMVGRPILAFQKGLFAWEICGIIGLRPADT